MIFVLWLLPLALALTLMSIPFLMRAAPVWGLMDNPGGRKRHERETPLIGGLAIAFGLLPVLCYFVIDPVVSLSWFVGALILLMLGVYDDLHELRPAHRFVPHLLVGITLCFADRELVTLGHLVDDTPLLLGVLALPVTLFAVAAAINAMNLVDGIDGLLGMLAVVPLSFIMFLAWHAGLSFELALSGSLLMALLAFLCFNLRFPWAPSARIFMGDAGSTLIGFTLAWLLISLARLNAMPPVLALYLIALPLLDTAGVIFRRYRAGLSAATPGRDHLHHILLDAGFTQNQTLLVLGALSLLIAGVGMLMNILVVNEALMFLFFLLLLSIYLLISSSATIAIKRLKGWFQSVD